MTKKEGYKDLETLKEEGKELLKSGNKDYIDGLEETTK